MAPTKDLTYHGRELYLFAEAKQWKAYWTSRVRRYLGEDVLEVGAGIGSNTLFLCAGKPRRWVCVEPDAQLAKQIQITLKDAPCRRHCEVITGTLDDVTADEGFDTILYIDVLEHIEDDRSELLRASTHLKPEGTLVVLSPAQPSLYSELDRAVGHLRRYMKETLIEISPPQLTLIQIEYLDALGMFASLANRILLKQENPTRHQIKLWDYALIPFSRMLHPLFRGRLGKSILAVWHRND